MGIRPSREHVETACLELVGQRVCVGTDLGLVLAERRRRGDPEARRLPGDHVLHRPALHSGEHRLVERGRMLFAAEDEAGPRAAQCLVRRRGDEVAVRHRIGQQAGCDEAGEMRHVAEQQRPDFVRDLAELVGFDDARVGGRAADDHPRPVLPSELEHLVVVDAIGLARDAVVHERVQLAGEVHLVTVRQVTPVVEAQAHHDVARLERGRVDRHVRLRAGMRLHIRVLGAEQLLGAVDRELLDLVDDLAPAVVAPTGITLGVLVRRDARDRLEDARPGEVLGGDQLDLSALPLELTPDQLGDLGIDVGEACAAKLLQRLLCNRHGGES